jgi:hypothetical protein
MEILIADKKRFVKIVLVTVLFFLFFLSPSGCGPQSGFPYIHTELDSGVLDSVAYFSDILLGAIVGIALYFIVKSSPFTKWYWRVIAIYSFLAMLIVIPTLMQEYIGVGDYVFAIGFLPLLYMIGIPILFGMDALHLYWEESSFTHVLGFMIGTLLMLAIYALIMMGLAKLWMMIRAKFSKK